MVLLVLSAAAIWGCASTNKGNSNVETAATVGGADIDELKAYYQRMLDEKDTEILRLRLRNEALQDELAAQKRTIERLEAELAAGGGAQQELELLREELEEAQRKLLEWERKWNAVIGQKKTYIIKEGDTLQKIAEDPTIYGDRNKWKLIYEANKEKIKDPDKLTPGTVIVIP